MRDHHTDAAPRMTWTTVTDAAGRTRPEMRWSAAPSVLQASAPQDQPLSAATARSAA